VPDSRTALVTGATSGLGAAFARRLAATGYDLVLVARDRDRLAATSAELAGRHRRVATLPADLSTAQGCAAVAVRLATGVDLLVNAAGISLNRSLLRSPVEDEERLLAVNVHAVLRLTRAALPPMVERRSGAVVNVSSVSSFAAVMPGSTYPASKAWVTAFTEAMALAVRGYGVRVMVVCPGYTRTELHARAGIDTRTTPGWFWLRADDVARDALRDLARGRVVSVPDWRYKVAAFALRHGPRRVFHRLARDTRGRTGSAESGGGRGERR
jgi:uncharacterized protein